MALLDWFKRLPGYEAGLNEITRLSMICTGGDGGADGTGISVATDYTPASLIKIVRIGGAGTIGYQLADGSSFQETVAAGDEIRSIGIAKIYSSLHATYSTSATLIKVYW